MLAALADPSKSMGDIQLPFENPTVSDVAAQAAITAPVNEWNLVYSPDVVARFMASPVTVHQRTCRPQYSFGGGVIWSDRAAAVLGKVAPERIISFHKLFGMFVKVNNEMSYVLVDAQLDR